MPSRGVSPISSNGLLTDNGDSICCLQRLVAQHPWTSRYRKQVTRWSLTNPAACMNA